MNISKKILDRDPSRYVVYEMMDYIKEQSGFELVSKETDNMYLFKTVPYANSLYNYAHVFSDKLSEEDFLIIKEFFGEDSFRVKMPENKEGEELLLSHGLKYKSIDYSMKTDDISNDVASVNLPDNCKILSSEEPGVLEDIKKIFCDAYNYALEDYNQKLGFFDSLMVDKDNKKVKGFVLYKDGKAVSSGDYYAFSSFSLENIGTLKTERGQGYGGIIVSYLLNKAKELGYTNACLVSSEIGCGVYQKVGFNPIIKEVTYIKN